MDQVHIDAYHLPNPQQVTEGLVVFKVDTGGCVKASRGRWVEHPVPDGKVWFTPDERLVIREDGGWKPMGA
jgi:hypothetical protein